MSFKIYLMDEADQPATEVDKKGVVLDTIEQARDFTVGHRTWNVHETDGRPGFMKTHPELEGVRWAVVEDQTGPTIAADATH